MQQRVADFIREHQLEPDVAEMCIEESAQETLETVNLYLTTVADAVKKHGGTLDKYIGDCVMAFWGAPTPNERHASDCVWAAIDAQRAIHDLNEKRSAQNNARETENRARLSAGLPPKPPLRALQLGTGINTGLATVGLMGSDAHVLNYTVFGREVNLASRLESVSGSGRIIISDTTYNHLLREDPALASTCIEMFPVTVKGIRDAVRIYEVPWQTPPAK
jgi:adenylate cyclase